MTTPLRIQPNEPLRGELDAIARPLPDDVEWRAGVELTPPGYQEVVLWDAAGCATEGYSLSGDTVTEKAPNGVAGGFKFHPTYVVASTECHVSGTQSAIGDIILQNAGAQLDHLQWRALEAVLHGAAPVYGPDGERNPSLNNLGDGPSAPTLPQGFDAANPGDLRGTLSGLLDSICECSKSDVVIHAPIAAWPYLQAIGVTWDASAGVYRYGPHLVSLGCYPNTGPQNIEDVTPTATDGTEVWLWTSGPIYTAFGEKDTIANLETRQNLASAIVERTAILAFDPVCVYAAKARVA